MGKLNLKKAQEVAAESNSGEWWASKYGGRYLLKPIEQRSFIVKRENEEKKLRAKLNLKKDSKLTDLQFVECAIRSYVGTYLVDWESVELDEGKPLELTGENFGKVCEAVPDLFMEMSGFIASKDAEHLERLEAASGN